MKWVAAAAVALVVPGGLIVLALAWWRHRHGLHDEGQYVARINEWYAKGPPIRPLALPAVRPLKAHRHGTGERVARFRRGSVR